MSETHMNAYAMELQEKKIQLSALQGEVDRLERIVGPTETYSMPEGDPVSTPEEKSILETKPLTKEDEKALVPDRDVEETEG